MDVKRGMWSCYIDKTTYSCAIEESIIEARAYSIHYMWFSSAYCNYIGLWKSKHVFVENFLLQIPRGLIISMAKCGDSTSGVKDVLGMDCDKCLFL
jgi:hypothetical protein